jgi:hypothetical protein
MKSFKKGKRVETKKEMAVIIANDLPYYMDGSLRFVADESYDLWSPYLNHGLPYYHAEEIKEPKKLGRLYMCKKSNSLKVYDNVTIVDMKYWAQVTINEKGEAFEAVTND